MTYGAARPRSWRRTSPSCAVVPRVLAGGTKPTNQRLRICPPLACGLLHPRLAVPACCRAKGRHGLIRCGNGGWAIGRDVEEDEMTQADRRSKLAEGVGDLVVDAWPAVGADRSGEVGGLLASMSQSHLIGLYEDDLPGLSYIWASLTIALVVVPWLLIGWLIWMWV